MDNFLTVFGVVLCVALAIALGCCIWLLVSLTRDAIRLYRNADDDATGEEVYDARR